MHTSTSAGINADNTWWECSSSAYHQCLYVLVMPPVPLLPVVHMPVICPVMGLGLFVSNCCKQMYLRHRGDAWQGVSGAPTAGAITSNLWKQDWVVGQQQHTLVMMS